MNDAELTVRDTFRSDPRLLVDLKWSLWSADWTIWNEKVDRNEDDQPSQTWQRMEAAFDGTKPPVRVITSPRKEIRYGSVVISEGRAEVFFEAVWDDAYELVDLIKWDLPEDRVDDAAEFIRRWFHEDDPIMVNEDGENLGARIEGTAFSDDFMLLMQEIDSLESALIVSEDERSKAFDEYLDGYLKVQLGLAEDDGGY